MDVKGFFIEKVLSEGNTFPISYNGLDMCTAVEYSVLTASRTMIT